MKIFLILIDLSNGNVFRKYFKTEYEKDKFKRKLVFSRKIKVLKDSTDEYYLD